MTRSATIAGSTDLTPSDHRTSTRDVTRRTQSFRSRFISCSQSRTTRQPRLRSFRKLLRSLCRFLRILSRQNGCRVFSQAGKRYPCQKSPSMKIAILSRCSTMSGLPGRSLTFFLNRQPCLKSSDLTSRSKSLSLVLTRDIR